MNAILMFMVAVFVVLIVLSSQVGNRFATSELLDHYYIYPEAMEGADKVNREAIAWRSVLIFYLLYNGIFPLDLPCMIIFVKTFYTYLMLENDAEMICEERSEQEGQLVGCSVKNLSLLEDLARVNYMFCDKTGTLTKN